tara:strand:+ start:249 stop:785 length:537 start_codon:yes stop_codon:yes gene_type:complete
MGCKIIWFTGLSGSGKTTLARRLKIFLINKNFKCLQIDGDSFRFKKKYKNSFTRSSIIRNNNLIIKDVERRKKYNDFIIVSVISPIKITREKAKKKFGDNYVEIFVNCSIKVLFKRDTKGLYRLAKNNQIKNLIGYNSNIKYEKTKYKKIVVNTNIQNINQSLNKIILKIKKKFNVKI